MSRNSSKTDFRPFRSFRLPISTKANDASGGRSYARWARALKDLIAEQPKLILPRDLKPARYRDARSTITEAAMLCCLTGSYETAWKSKPAHYDLLVHHLKHNGFLVRERVKRNKGFEIVVTLPLRTERDPAHGQVAQA